MKTVHLVLKRFKCDQCDMTFRDRYNLKCHTPSHKDEGLHKDQNLCSHCGTVFQSKKLLNRHIRCVQKGAKTAKCNICDKRFRDNYGLRRHLSEGHKYTEGDEEENSGHASFFQF